MRTYSFTNKLSSKITQLCVNYNNKGRKNELPIE